MSLFRGDSSKSSRHTTGAFLFLDKGKWFFGEKFVLTCLSAAFEDKKK